MENTLLRLNILLTPKGVKVTKKLIEVDEKSKCFDTIEKPSKRFRKTMLNEVTTNLKNTLGSGTDTIGYSLFCLPENEKVCTVLLKNTVYDTIKDIRKSANEMFKVLIESEN